MRTVSAIFVGSIAALAILTAPVLAKTSDAQQTDDKATSPSCHSYEQNPDGSWKPLPCQELGSPAQPQRKPATRSVDGSSH
ncbi:MAG: hypothetical protein QOE39_843 [Bradyrhizobium sp.]|jgi:hypothetical protein|nr:hypothetical protein [Bradyrhizobium sp.]